MIHLYNRAAKICLLILAALFFVSNTIAQVDKSSSENSDKSENFSFRSVSVVFGIYDPSMDYWKEESFFKDGNYKPSLYVGANGEYSFTNWIGLRFGAGFWRQETISDSDVFGEVKMELNGIPINLDVLTYINIAQFSIFTPYAGVGADFLLLKNKLTFPKSVTDEQQGATVTGHALAGLSGKLSENFAIAGEFQYHFGSYIQQFYTDETLTVTTEETISLSGPKINLSFIYLF